MCEDVLDGASQRMDMASLGGTVKVLDIVQCQLLAAMLEAASSHLSQDVQASLIKVEVIQSQLWSAEQVQQEAKVKLEAMVKCLEELKDDE